MGNIFRIAVLIPSQFDLHVLGKFQGVVRRIAAVIGECPGGIGISVIISLKGQFEPFFLAIMQQESAGSVPDVMQASESPFNTWYANTPNSIPDPDYSIRVGVETFAYCLEEAGCAAPNQKERLKLALQER